MKNTFTNYKAKQRFFDLYKTMTEERQRLFGKAVREAFEKKITSMEAMADYYLTVEDVNQVFIMLPSSTPVSDTRMEDHIHSRLPRAVLPENMSADVLDELAEQSSEEWLHSNFPEDVDTRDEKEEYKDLYKHLYNTR